MKLKDNSSRSSLEFHKTEEFQRHHRSRKGLLKHHCRRLWMVEVSYVLSHLGLIEWTARLIVFGSFMNVSGRVKEFDL